MIKEILNNFSCNKNIMLILMVFIYILAIVSVFTETSFILASVFTLLFILMIVLGFAKPKYLLLFAIVFYFGIFNTQSRIKVTDDILNLTPVNAVVEGQIVSLPVNKRENQISFYFNVDNVETEDYTKEYNNEKILVRLDSANNLKIYNHYRIEGRLSPPSKLGNPSQFDYPKYLANYGVYSVLYGTSETQPILLKGNLTKKEKFIQSVGDYREAIIRKHSKYLKTPNLEILGGIVFGDDAVNPPEKVKESFINSGLLHILAASGMNVAFIFSFFFFIFSTLRFNYKLNISIGILMVLTYSLMTGLGASVVRATCMLIFVLIGKLIDRDAHSVSLLAFVAFCMLVYNPMYINNIGFQLSFIVTLGLLLMVPVFTRSKNKIVNWIYGTVSIPIVAQLWVIPLQIFYFNNISLYSVFANIMSVPILSIISFGGFISSLLSPILPEIICKWCDIILNPCITLLLNISDFWGKLPHSSIQTTHPSILQIMFYYFILLLITALFYKDIREKYLNIFVSFLIVFVISLFLTFIPKTNNNLVITSFDVGNADAFLIKTPSNRHIMIDTGRAGYNGGISQAKFFILKYLMDNGIKFLDSIIVTHFDSDHSGGVVDFLKGIKVKNLYVNSMTNEAEMAQEIYEAATEQGVNLVKAGNNQEVLSEKELLIQNFVLQGSDIKHDNDASIVTLLKYKDFEMLFTGDAGIKTFSKMKNKLPKNIDILKVGHHGANKVVNKDMVEYLNPKFSLISVGKNSFGHPTVETLAILRNTKILRTDIFNSIRIIVNDKGYDVYNYDSNLHKYVLVQ